MYELITDLSDDHFSAWRKNALNYVRHHCIRRGWVPHKILFAPFQIQEFSLKHRNDRSRRTILDLSHIFSVVGVTTAHNIDIIQIERLIALIFIPVVRWWS